VERNRLALRKTGETFVSNIHLWQGSGSVKGFYGTQRVTVMCNLSRLYFESYLGAGTTTSWGLHLRFLSRCVTFLHVNPCELRKGVGVLDPSMSWWTGQGSVRPARPTSLSLFFSGLLPPQL
jgi:hypothetical protein